MNTRDVHPTVARGERLSPAQEDAILRNQYHEAVAEGDFKAAARFAWTIWRFTGRQTWRRKSDEMLSRADKFTWHDGDVEIATPT